MAGPVEALSQAVRRYGELAKPSDRSGLLAGQQELPGTAELLEGDSGGGGGSRRQGGAKWEWEGLWEMRIQ